MPETKKPHIKIQKDGPYLITGNVPLYELIIESVGEDYRYREGRVFPQRPAYALCRCGKSANKPFCDGTHGKERFIGTETASREAYLEQTETIEGPGITLTDCEDLCAFARFCHSEEGNVWELTRKSADPTLRALAIKTAEDCPSGRLVAWDKLTGEAYEPAYEPSIVIIQDPERNCSGPIWVRGGIQIEGADGFLYEVRNRVTLCRCGRSYNKPFCDATHVSYQFKDGL
ncbi:MAG: iron-binding protein [Clostridiales bacterium 43-6]|nr:MAG: iron-binding protein [Clostridiales bacterium 43-6]